MRIAITGDVMLGRLVNEALQVKGASWPWGDTLALFKTADWRCCNLECVLSDIEPPFFRGPKVFRFRSDRTSRSCRLRGSTPSGWLTITLSILKRTPCSKC